MKDMSKNHITRRDFLKLAGLMPLSFAASRRMKPFEAQQNHHNVILIVFDALSARNISFFGYQRDTMPNLAKLSERAIIYHNHYAPANFTTPGTASLLTGTLPWTHRAFRNNGTVEESFVKKNIFSTFDDFYNLTYSHNPWVYTLLEQFEENINELIPLEKLLLLGENFIPKILNHDKDIATVSWIRTIKRNQDGNTYSLFLSHLYEQYEKYREARFGELQSIYPRGLPSIDYINYIFL